MGRIYDVWHWDGLKIGARIQAILKYFPSSLKGCNVGITDITRSGINEASE
jgi:hypothetical protein